MHTGRLLPALVLTAVVTLTLTTVGCGKQSGQETPPTKPADSPVVSSSFTDTAAATVTVKPAESNAAKELQKVRGRWLRRDGGYILEIKAVDAQGKMDAAYFNPNPISVTNAVARMEGDDIKILVELSGLNYPGSRYELTFISAAGLMAGTYYQAALKETFDVVFERVR